MIKKLQENKGGEGAKWPGAIPSSSKSKKEISLLDAGIMNVFFKQYNNVATNVDFRKRYHDKKVTRRSEHKALDQHLKNACKRRF